MRLSDGLTAVSGSLVGVMDKKRFNRFLERDGGCIHCGELDAVAPHHRRNRGMGGSKDRDTPSNIVVLCSVLNGLLESDPHWARKARDWGWKLTAGQDPTTTPVWIPVEGAWFTFDDNYKRYIGGIDGRVF